MNILIFCVILLIAIAILFAVLGTVQAKAIELEKEYALMCDRHELDRFKQWVHKQRRM